MKLDKSIPIISAAVLFGLTSCGRTQQAALDEHAYEENLQLTAYSDTFEVYAEAKPFVVGQPSDILAHFSSLKNFKPLAEGSVTVSLIVGENSARQTLETPTSPGIYKFAITPETIGTGDLMFDIDSPAGKSRILVPDVIVYKDAADAQHAAAEAETASSNGVVFPKEQSWKVDFATEMVKREPFGQTIRTAAQIAPSQADERVVTAKGGGIVIFNDGDVVPGKAVAAGQTAFTIESGGMADNNLAVRYKEAAAEYDRAKTEYERKRDLATERIVSQRDLLQAETEYRNAETVYNNLRKNFSDGRQRVSTPIAGFVKQVLVANGDYVEAGQPVLVVSQNRDLLVTAQVQPRYSDLLADIVGATIRPLSGERVYSLEELDGKMLSYGRVADAANPLIPVTFRVRNNASLLPGSFVEMYIKTRATGEALTVPNEALVEEMGVLFVFVQLTPEFFEKRPVKIGATDGSRTEIRSGVTENDRVVSKGAILVKLAQSASALDTHSGHAH